MPFEWSPAMERFGSALVRYQSLSLTALYRIRGLRHRHALPMVAKIPQTRILLGLRTGAAEMILLTMFGVGLILLRGHCFTLSPGCVFLAPPRTRQSLWWSNAVLA